MTDKTTNNADETETVDAESLRKPSDPISKATLIMVAGAILLVIIATIIFIFFFNAPAGSRTAVEVINAQLNTNG